MLNTNNQLSDYWTINPHLINEFRIGFMGEYDIFTPATIGGGYPQKLGLQFSKADIFPAVSINTYYSLAPGSPSNTNYKENTFDISDQVLCILTSILRGFNQYLDESARISNLCRRHVIESQDYSVGCRLYFAHPKPLGDPIPPAGCKFPDSDSLILILHGRLPQNRRAPANHGD